MKKLLLIPILLLFSCGDSVVTKSITLKQTTGEVVFDGDSFYATKFQVDSIEYIAIKSKTDGSVAITKHR